ncbi:hypothetical protein BAE44_0022145 [Dichanthelium oligosanthes]|uniref:Uncharacterized protein n=1 Tax=Dichanthelium oligosanthes TaxID=888268 RepID=A0A1E5UVJ9_9POAL|nr:hypothetical protein BAE44_0022145 [Dichanthelium oligosanthes]
MASFASRLKDMFIVLVERVTGYGSARGEDLQVFRTEDQVTVVQRNEIRPRSSDPAVSQGSGAQRSTGLLECTAAYMKYRPIWDLYFDLSNPMV